MTKTDEFLEHYGVIGMKWGVRRAQNKKSVHALRGEGLSRRKAKNTVRAQNRIDHQKVVATKTRGEVGLRQIMKSRATSNSSLSIGTVAKHPLSAKKAASLQLSKNKDTQSKIANGEKKVAGFLLNLQGVSVKHLDFDT